MIFDLDATATEPDVSTVEGLLQELENQVALLIVVHSRAVAMPTWADLDGRLAGLAPDQRAAQGSGCQGVA